MSMGDGAKAYACSSTTLRLPRLAKPKIYSYATIRPTAQPPGASCPLYYPYITLILPLYILIFYPYITLILPLFCILSRGLFPRPVDASDSVEVEPFARVGALRYSGGILCYACYHNLGGPANWGGRKLGGGGTILRVPMIRSIFVWDVY